MWLTSRSSLLTQTAIGTSISAWSSSRAQVAHLFVEIAQLADLIFDIDVAALAAHLSGIEEQDEAVHEQGPAAQHVVLDVLVHHFAAEVEQVEQGGVAPPRIDIAEVKIERRGQAVDGGGGVLVAIEDDLHVLVEFEVRQGGRFLDGGGDGDVVVLDLVVGRDQPVGLAAVANSDGGEAQPRQPAVGDTEFVVAFTAQDVTRLGVALVLNGGPLFVEGALGQAAGALLLLCGHTRAVFAPSPVEQDEGNHREADPGRQLGHAPPEVVRSSCPSSGQRPSLDPSARLGQKFCVTRSDASLTTRASTRASWRSS